MAITSAAPRSTAAASCSRAAQFWLLATPIAYPSSLIPDRYRPLYGINPMAGVVQGFRWAILDGGHAMYLPGLMISILGVALLLVSGIWYFRRTERTFADVI